MKYDKEILVKASIKKLKTEKQQLERELTRIPGNHIYNAHSKRKRIREINKRLVIVAKDYPELLF